MPTTMLSRRSERAAFTPSLSDAALDARIQVQTLDGIHLHAESQPAQSLFAELIALRAAAYGQIYSRAYLPYSTYDFAARHQLVFVEGFRGAVAAVTQISLDTCDHFGIPFPMLEHAYAMSSAPHIRAMEELIDQHRSSGAPLVFTSRYCVRPELRQDRAVARRLRELCFSLHVSNVDLSAGGRIVCQGVYLKTSLQLEAVGFTRMRVDGVLLQPLLQAGLGEVVFMQMERPSPRGERWLARTQHLLPAQGASAAPQSMEVV